MCLACTGVHVILSVARSMRIGIDATSLKGWTCRRSGMSKGMGYAGWER
jgi:hypothetical protein